MACVFHVFFKGFNAASVFIIIISVNFAISLVSTLVVSSASFLVAKSVKSNSVFMFIYIYSQRGQKLFETISEVVSKL